MVGHREQELEERLGSGITFHALGHLFLRDPHGHQEHPLAAWRSRAGFQKRQGFWLPPWKQAMNQVH